MSKYLFLYYGEWEHTQEMMDAWTNWFASIGDHLVDGGSPLGPGQVVAPDGTQDLTPEMGPASGYSIVNADNMDDAVKLLEDCPIVSSVRVYEAMSM